MSSGVGLNRPIQRSHRVYLFVRGARHHRNWMIDWCTACHDLVIWHYGDVIMCAIASQITSLTIVYSTVYSDAVQRKHQSSASLAYVRWIHRWPVNSPHKWPVTRKMFPFNDVIMERRILVMISICSCFIRLIVFAKMCPIANSIFELWFAITYTFFCRFNIHF